VWGGDMHANLRHITGRGNAYETMCFFSSLYLCTLHLVIFFSYKYALKYFCFRSVSLNRVMAFAGMLTVKS